MPEPGTQGLRHGKQRESVAIVHHRFGPYHAARIEAAAGLMGDHWDVYGVEMSPTTDIYRWDQVSLNQPAKHLRVADRDTRSMSSADLKRVVAECLDAVKPSVIAVPGWSDNGATELVRWAVRNDVPCVLMSESNRDDFTRSAVKEWIKTQYVKNFSSALVGGTRASLYVQDLKMPKDRIETGYDVVNNDRYAAPNPEAIREVRQRFGIDRTAFLCSARLVEKKNLATAIRAFAAFRSAGADTCDWLLVIAGDGPLESSLRDLAQQLKVDDQIRWTGFCQAEDMAALYHATDALIHVSIREQWGLVVNEAMAAGRPVIVSAACGSATDLVNEETGWVVDPFDVESITGAMTELATNEMKRRKMGQRGRERIADWGPDRYAVGMKNACEKALAEPRNRSFLSKAVLRWM